MKSTILLAAMVAGMMLPAVDAEAKGRGERPDFATLDTNGDGSLTLAEVQAHGQARFNARDTDGNGVLSEAELLAAAQERDADRAARMVARMLSRLDTNEDGAIGQDELSDRGDRATRMFERADANSDGVISAEEFAEMPDRGGRRGQGKRDGESNDASDNG